MEIQEFKGKIQQIVFPDISLLEVENVDSNNKSIIGTHMIANNHAIIIALSKLFPSVRRNITY